MKIYPVATKNNTIRQYNNYTAEKKEFLNSETPKENINTTYPALYFLGKYQAISKPKNVVKALNSAIKYNNKEKAAKIMADFYKASGGYQGIINNPDLEFEEFEDNVANNNYTHKYTLKDYQELFVKEGSIAYRQNEKIYEVDIEKNSKPNLKESQNASILFYDLCNKASSELQEEGAEKSAQTLQNFWIEHKGYQNITDMMGKKARPLESSNNNDEYYLKTKSGILILSKDKIGIQCTKKDIQTNRYSKIMVELDKNDNIKCYHAENYTNMGIGIYDSICCY